VINDVLSLAAVLPISDLIGIQFHTNDRLRGVEILHLSVQIIVLAERHMCVVDCEQHAWRRQSVEIARSFPDQ